MGIKLLLLLLLTVSCGKDVALSNSKLEKFSSITEADTSKTLVSGTFIRAAKNGDFDYIKTDGATYKISVYSSNDTFKFIAATPIGTQVPVNFRGKIKGDEIVLETIQAQE